jgi:hypothetical protein
MIFLQLTQQLKSLSNLLLQLTNEQYGKKIIYLGNASIGAHSRHIIELLQCVTHGYNRDIVDYVNRVRDLSLETDSNLAIKALNDITTHMIQPDKPLQLVTECDAFEKADPVTTTFYREIVYNTEHAIHHLALIRVALREMQLHIVDDNFGMAYSTIKFLAAQPKNQHCDA